MKGSQLLHASFQQLGAPSEVRSRFVQCLLENEGTCAVLQRQVLVPYLEEYLGKTNDELKISAYSLIRADQVLGHLLLQYSDTLLPVLEEATLEAQHHIRADLVKALHRKLSPASHPARNAGPTRAQVCAANQFPLPSYLVPAMSEVELERLKSRLEEDSRPGGERSKGPNVEQRAMHARLVNLPPEQTFCRSTVSSLRSTDVGKIVQLSGTVVRASPVRMMEFKRSYKCKSCSHAFDVKASIDQPHNGLVLPSVCPTSYMQSNDKEEKKCTSTTFEPIVMTSGGAACQQSNNNGVQYTDYQEIKIQESAAGLEIGSIPRSLLIKIIHGDLVDSCQPGDEIFVVGNLMAHWEPLQANLDCHVHTILEAHSIRVVNADDHSGWKGGSDNSSVREQFEREFDTFWDKNTAKYPIAARNFIVSAVCPKLYGMLVIKLALLLTLIGGSDASNSTIDVEHCDPTNTATRIPVDVNLHDDNDEPDQFYFGGPSLTSKKGSKRSNGGTTNSSFKSESRPSTLSASGNQSIQSRRRTQSHILLVGDPGTGKSQFLKFAAALSPRSVLTTGTGCSSAGLTCAAVKEAGGEFTLEAGALVLADRGVCCIDEFGCIRQEDRTTIHEAMEQQTLSVAKAGIVCKLNSRATVVAVMNPKGALYNTECSVAKNTDVGSPLLSRFDLIFVMLDTSDLERDAKIARFLLANAVNPNTGYETTRSAFALGESERGASAVGPCWSMEKLRSYVAHVKERFHPTLSPEAARLLQAHYNECRSADKASVQITVRFLESLIRLSQAHARLMHRNTVTLQDAVATILVMECSAAATGGLHNVSSLHGSPMETDFPSFEEADLIFQREEYEVLSRYGMLEYFSGGSDFVTPPEYSGEQTGSQQNDDAEDPWHMYSTNNGRQQQPVVSQLQHSKRNRSAMTPTPTMEEDQYGRPTPRRSPLLSNTQRAQASMITPDNLHHDLNHPHQQQQSSMAAMTPNPDNIRVHFSQFPENTATGGFHSPESNAFHHTPPSTHRSVEVQTQPNNRMHPQQVTQSRTKHKKRTRRPD